VGLEEVRMQAAAFAPSMLRAWSAIIRQAPGATSRRRAVEWKTSMSGF